MSRNLLINVCNECCKQTSETTYPLIQGTDSKLVKCYICEEFFDSKDIRHIFTDSQALKVMIVMMR